MINNAAAREPEPGPEPQSTAPTGVSAWRPQVNDGARIIRVDSHAFSFLPLQVGTCAAAGVTVRASVDWLIASRATKHV
jgi:hypothetical protein